MSRKTATITDGFNFALFMTPPRRNNQIPEESERDRIQKELNLDTTTSYNENIDKISKNSNIKEVLLSKDLVKKLDTKSVYSEVSSKMLALTLNQIESEKVEHFTENISPINIRDKHFKIEVNDLNNVKELQVKLTSPINEEGKFDFDFSKNNFLPRKSFDANEISFNANSKHSSSPGKNSENKNEIRINYYANNINICNSTNIYPQNKSYDKSLDNDNYFQNKSLVSNTLNSSPLYLINQPEEPFNSNVGYFLNNNFNFNPTNQFNPSHMPNNYVNTQFQQYAGEYYPSYPNNMNQMNPMYLMQKNQFYTQKMINYNTPFSNYPQQGFPLNTGTTKQPVNIHKTVNSHQPINENHGPAQNKKKRQFAERQGDWVCMKCKNLNFSFRVVCNRCQLPRSENDAMCAEHMKNLKELTMMNDMLQNRVLNQSQVPISNISNNNFNSDLFSPNPLGNSNVNFQSNINNKNKTKKNNISDTKYTNK